MTQRRQTHRSQSLCLNHTYPSCSIRKMSARGCGCNQDGTLSDWHELTWKRLTPEVYLHLQVKVRCENSISADKSYMSALTFTKNGQKDPGSEERVIFCSPTALSKVRVDVLLHLWNLLMDINGCRSEKEEMQQKPFFQKSLEKHWPHMISRLSLTTLTNLSDSEEHPNSQKLILRELLCFQDSPTRALAVAFISL